MASVTHSRLCFGGASPCTCPAMTTEKPACSVIDRRILLPARGVALARNRGEWKWPESGAAVRRSGVSVLSGGGRGLRRHCLGQRRLLDVAFVLSSPGIPRLCRRRAPDRCDRRQTRQHRELSVAHSGQRGFRYSNTDDVRVVSIVIASQRVAMTARHTFAIMLTTPEIDSCRVADAERLIRAQTRFARSKDPQYERYAGSVPKNRRGNGRTAREKVNSASSNSRERMAGWTGLDTSESANGTGTARKIFRRSWKTRRTPESTRSVRATPKGIDAHSARAGGTQTHRFPSRFG